MTDPIEHRATPTTCPRCQYGNPDVHDLTPRELALAEHFLAEVYNGHGDPSRGSYPPADLDVMLTSDPHYLLCANAIRTARRLLAAGVLDNLSDNRPVLDAAHIEHQRAWSERTFGPSEDRGPAGPLAHLRKELDEVAAGPHDLEEWVDVLILSIDGAWRAGHEPQAIIDAVKAKQAKNEARTWPEWRGVPSDQPIEHIR